MYCDCNQRKKIYQNLLVYWKSYQDVWCYVTAVPIKQAFSHWSAALPKTSFLVFPCEFWEIFQNSCCAVIPEILYYIMARFVLSLLASSKLQLYPKAWLKFDLTCCNVKKNKVDINRTLFFSEENFKKPKTKNVFVACRWGGSVDVLLTLL